MLSEYIKNNMAKNKHTPRSMALECEISYSTIYRIINGHRASNQTIRKLAKYYNLELEQVVRMNDNQ